LFALTSFLIIRYGEVFREKYAVKNCRERNVFWLSGATYENMPSKIQQSIVEGQVFPIEGQMLRAVHAPGRSSDHVCFILEEENAMFKGDNVLGHGTTAVEQLSTWMGSLDVMHSHNCALGYPAHGMVIKDLPAKIKLKLSAKKKREKQMLQALTRTKKSAAKGKGSMTVRQLVV
jgi:glyoxylase-like metal-dependent hydrolase (beta-lactamase superfamily II)